MNIINAIGKYKLKDRSWFQREVSDIKKIVVHHSARPTSNNTNEEILNILMGDHTTQGWPGLSYHFVILKNGAIYQINNLSDITWTDSINVDSVAICLDGYFHPDFNEQPTQEQLTSLKWLLDNLSTQHPEFPASQKDVMGHRERYATACSGNNLFPYVVEYRNNLGKVDWQEDKQVEPLVEIVPGEQYRQDQLPAELFNVTDKQVVYWDGKYYIAHANSNGTRTFTIKPEDPKPDPAPAPVDPTPQPAEPPKYTESQYKALEKQLEESRQMLQDESKKLQDINNNYSAMQALGYNTLNDINKALEVKDATNKGLLVQINSLKKQLESISTQYAENQKEDTTSIEMGLDAAEALKELRINYEQVLIALGVKGTSLPTILEKIDSLQAMAEKGMSIIERTKILDKKKLEQIREIEKRGKNWLTQFLQAVAGHLSLTGLLIFGFVYVFVRG